ncbi:MAG: transglycosylase SLT domain-containing protein [Candidatus Rokubacteria bacterium]|nr:transglycosylase SLT domain-containing protein [Candidatus Rokubacteria bacterium]
MIDRDPWAEAFAESARLNVRPQRVSDVPGFPIVMNPQVQAFLDRFTGSRREVVTLWLSRSGHYLGMIREVLQDHGLPEDLAFVAMIESGYNPLAVSRAGAKGLWQFMAGTARGYGLRVDQWVDERLDPHKSTVAAAAYLRDLYRQYGSWSLAQAAYNAGEGAVTRAVRRLGTSDFWTLARSAMLRRETKDFVPQIHAATVIGRDPGRYGFELQDHSPTDVDIVSVPPSTNLKSLATAAGVSSEMLKGLNPALVRGVTPPGARYDLRVPFGTRDGVVAALARPGAPVMARRVPGDLATAANGVHVVQPRDTISGIAKAYGVKIDDLLRWNRLTRQDRIRPGDRLHVADLHASADGARGAAVR